MTESRAVEMLRQGDKYADEVDFTYEEYCEALNMAIQALEEIQQYRAIGTVEEIQQKLAELDRWHTSKINEKIRNPFAHTSTSICHNCDHKDEYIEELEAKLEECRTAVERMKPRKPKESKMWNLMLCPNCGNNVMVKEKTVFRLKYCCNCGQAIDWSE